MSSTILNGRSTWRPGEAASAEEMEVYMKNLLAAISVAVGYYPVSLFRQTQTLSYFFDLQIDFTNH